MTNATKSICKKLIFALACVAPCLAIAQDADSKAMLDSLVERNILRDEQARDLSKLIASVSTDGTKSNKTTLQLRMQATYEYFDTNSDARGETNMFDLRRCFFTVRTQYDNGWGLEATIDPTASNFFRASYIYKKFDSDFLNGRIDFGYSKPKFISEQYLSGFNQYATERSIVNNFWCSNFNQRGCLGLGGFHTGIFTVVKINDVKGLSFNGAITNPTANDVYASKATSATPALWAGVAYERNILDTKTIFAFTAAYGSESNYESYEDKNQKGYIFQINPSVCLSAKNYRASVDFVWAQVQRGKLGNATACPFGAVAQFEYYIETPNFGKVAPVVRYAYLDGGGRGFQPDKIERHLKSDQLDRAYDEAHSLYFGINWYILGNDLKLQIGYERLFYTGNADGFSGKHRLHENALRLLLQTQF